MDSSEGCARRHSKTKSYDFVFECLLAQPSEESISLALWTTLYVHLPRDILLVKEYSRFHRCRLFRCQTTCDDYNGICQFCSKQCDTPISVQVKIFAENEGSPNRAIGNLLRHLGL